MSSRRRSSSAPILSLPILIIVLPIITLILLFIVVPPFLTITSQIFRPYNNTTVKKSWDSLNLFLVLFAIFCGVLARRNDEESNGGADVNTVSSVSDSMEKNRQQYSHQWFDPTLTAAATETSARLRRSSSSYPDLREDGLWETGDDRFRFFDDFDIQHKYYRSPDATAQDNNYAHQLRRTRSDFEEYSQVKEIPVDTVVLRSSFVPAPKSPTPPPPPPPPPPPAVRREPRRTYQTVRQKEGRAESNDSNRKVQSSPPPPPKAPPPPPPPPPPPVQTESKSKQKYIKIESRKSNATREIKMVLTSFYNQRKRIKKKHKTKNNMYDYDKSVHSTPQHSTIPPPSPPPPPPPPPPPHPPSVFHNLFKKNRKSKKVHDVPPPPPPPPPVPPRLSKRKSHAPPPPPPPAPPTPPRQPSSTRRNATNNGKPPLPTNTRSNNRLYDENVNSGNQSPLIPRPPPPPPFKMAEFKFAVHGDFVSIHSSHSSRCASPELGETDGDGHDDDVMSNKEKANVTGDGVRLAAFCPSPDVNVKADSFIARLRDEWRLEKINSIREKQKLN